MKYESWLQGYEQMAQNIHVKEITSDKGGTMGEKKTNRIMLAFMFCILTLNMHGTGYSHGHMCRD